MSLDSVQARFSVVGVARPWLKGAYPDVTLSAVWRLGVGWTYAGNELSTVSAIAALLLPADKYVVPAQATDRYSIPTQRADKYAVPAQPTDRYIVGRPM